MKASDQRSLRRHKDRLADLLRAGGYFRTPNRERRQRDELRYKKGWEVRLVVDSEDELAAVRQSLVRLGVAPGAPFRKHHRIVQPVYSRAAVEQLLRCVGRGGLPADALRRRRRPRPVPATLRLADLIRRTARRCCGDYGGGGRRSRESAILADVAEHFETTREDLLKRLFGD